MRPLPFLLPLVLFACAGDKDSTDTIETGETKDTSVTEVPDADERAAEITAIYESMVTFVNGSMPELEAADQMQVTVRNIVTVDKADFEKHVWLDILDMPNGQMVDTLRTETYWSPEDVSTVTYSAEWFELEKEIDYTQTADGEPIPPRNAEEVTGLLVEHVPGISPIDVLSLFDVVLNFTGTERSYKAIALWSEGDATDRSTILIADNVLNGIQEISQESGMLASECPPVTKPPPPAQMATKSCVASESSYPLAISDSDDAEHLFFEHSATAESSASCACSATCTSTCSVEWIKRSCEDSRFDILPEIIAPIIRWTHEKRTVSKTTVGTVVDGTQNGAECGVGFICSIKSCAFGVCSFSISIPIGAGGKLSLSGDEGQVWSGELLENYTCAPCEEEDPVLENDTYTGSMEFDVTYVDYGNPQPQTHQCALAIDLESDEAGNVEGEFLCETNTINMIEEVKVKFVGSNEVELTVKGASGELQSETIGWTVPITTETGYSGEFALILTLNQPHGENMGGAVDLNGGFNVDKTATE